MINPQIKNHSSSAKSTMATKSTRFTAMSSIRRAYPRSSIAKGKIPLGHTYVFSKGL